MKILERGLWVPNPMEGHFTLELFDGDTGKKQEHVEADNYVTDYANACIKFAARQWFNSRAGAVSPNQDTFGVNNFDWIWPSSSITTAAGINTDFLPTGPPNGVLLTNDTHVVNASADRFVQGNLIAWSYLDQWAGADTRRGSINAGECSVSPTQVTFVFDWPTSAGNGSIGSVYWVFTTLINGSGAYNYHNDMYIKTAASGSPVPGFGSTVVGSTSLGFNVNAFSFGAGAGLYLDPDGTHYWTAINNATTGHMAVVQRAISNGAVTSTVQLGSGTNPIGFANDGSGSLGNWWVWDNGAATLFKFPATGGAATGSWTATTLGIPNPNSLFSIPFFYAGGFLWIGVSTPARMMQIGNLATTPTLAATVTLSTAAGIGQQGLINTGNYCAGLYYPDAVNGDELWISNLSTGVGVYDLSGNWRRAFTTPCSLGSGMALWPGGGIGSSVVSGSGNPSANLTQTLFINNNCRQMHARALLPSVVNKANTQTMKLTYQFTYS